MFFRFAFLKGDFAMEIDVNHFKERMDIYREIYQIVSNKSSIKILENRDDNSILPTVKNSPKNDLWNVNKLNSFSIKYSILRELI